MITSTAGAANVAAMQSQKGSAPGPPELAAPPYEISRHIFGSKGSAPGSQELAGPPYEISRHIFGSEPQVDTCYKERYVQRLTRVGATTPGGTGGNRFYSEADPAMRFFNAHWIYDWDYVSSTQSWTGSWRYLKDSLDTKNGEILTGWIWHSNFKSSGNYTTQPVEYELAERERCGSYLLWHEHIHEDWLNLGCILATAATLVVIIGASIVGTPAAGAVVSTFSLGSGTICLTDAINDFFSTNPSSVIYVHDEDRWIIETGSPSWRVFIPDGPWTIQVYGT